MSAESKSITKGLSLFFFFFNFSFCVELFLVVNANDEELMQELCLAWLNANWTKWAAERLIGSAVQCSLAHTGSQNHSF